MNSRTLTAAFLREPHALNGVVPLAADVCAMLADALEIADRSAQDIIQCECDELDDYWIDLSSADSIALDALAQAVRYLEARGLLERGAECTHLVQLLDAPKIEA